MEVQPAKKKNAKTMPTAINIGAGAGSFGMGGIVLFGGALVAATIASALAFKTGRQRRSRSHAGKSMSPSLETQIESVNSQNQSDQVASIKEMQIKAVGESSPEENQNSDKKEDPGSIVDEYQNYYADSGFVGEELDNCSEIVDVGWEEQVVVEPPTEPGLRSSEEHDGGEERKCWNPIDNERDEHVDLGPANSLVSINNISVVEDDGNRIYSEATMAKEEIDAACVDFENTEDASMTDHKVEALDVEETDVDEDLQTFSDGDHCLSAVASTMNLNESLVVAVCEDDSPTPLTNKEEKGEESQKVEERVSADVQEIEDAKVDDQKVEREETGEEPAQTVKEQVSTDVQEIEFPDVQAIGDAEVDDRKVEREETDEEAAQKVEESVSRDVQAMEESKVNDQTVEGEEKGEEPAKKVEEHASTVVQVIEEAKVDDQVERQKESEETAAEVQVQTSAEDEFVNKEETSKEDETTLVPLIKEDEEAKDDKEDATVKTEDVNWQEEPTPEAKMGNEEKMTENRSVSSKDLTDSNQNMIIINEKGRKCASRYSEAEAWNLKPWTWSILISIWCLCHWYSELPFPELSLISSFLFILILKRYQNRTTSLFKHE